ncbi:unnamed protein product [Diatraea saccharalis]|uniref:Uncharacterized protein n=1 Tax=Diatraea saccharalis TaxID=40085 RepID=A0A9N9WK98_9NEOP|nr:unnamed protein product [Diatraea saccharalis]
MKHDNGGMVAVVQGLDDAGLVVTLMGRRTNACAKANGGVTHAKSSIETRAAILPTTNTAAQVLDDRYTSSYKVAHCNVTPTSPPPNSSEFLKQRNEINPRLSNVQCSKATEAFVNSLRKYPNVSPERQQSSDFIERLLAYTQAKNCELKKIYDLLETGSRKNIL